MTFAEDYWPSAAEPLLIMAMDHRESFGRSLFGVRHDRPDPGQQAARAVVAQMRSGGRDGVRAIVLGRDAPADRLDHWLAVAAPVDGFVGFAIGRSIWEDPISDHNQGRAGPQETVSRIAGRYLDFARQYCAASGAGTPAGPSPDHA